MKNQFPLMIGLVSAGFWAATSHAGTDTIGDLLKRKVDVRVGEHVAADPDKARRNYEQFLDLTTGDDALRTDALRRLGDLKLEEGETARLERDLGDRAPLQTLDAIKLYSKLLEAYPDYTHNDAVLYQLARAYEANHEAEQSVATLDLLVKRYPASPRAAEAQFRRGEFFFAQQAWAQAEAAYSAVVSGSPTSEFFEQSLYKLGWSRFKRADLDGALDAFRQLLDQKLLTGQAGERDLADFSRPQRELIEDTLRVMAIAFSADEEATGVERFLRRTGSRPYAHLLYSTLGDLYASKERWTDAANSYSAYAKYDPDNERAPLLQSVAIDVYRRGGFTALVLEGKREYVGRYGLASVFWKTHRREDLPLVVRELKSNLTDLAAYYHEKAQASKASADYEEAARWYREVLSEFPDDPATAEVAYMLADALFESRQYEQAAAEYERVAYGYPNFEKAPTAGYAAVVAYDRQEGVLDGDARRAWHAKALEASLRFATSFPDHPESGAVLLRVARAWFDAGDFGRAADVADIALSRPKAVSDAQRQMAWTVAANAQFELGRFDRAEAAYREALAGAPAATVAALTDRLAASIYRQAEAHRSAHEDAQAADDFLRVGQLAPTSSIRATADFDAAAALLAARQWTRAIAVLEAFRREHSSSELQADVTKKLAVAYTEADRPNDAAAEWERVSNASGAPDDVRQAALTQAIDLYDKGHDPTRLKGALEAFVRRFPQASPVSIEYRQRLADIARDEGASARRMAVLTDLVAVEKGMGEARSDRSRYLAAKASFELALPLRDAVAKVPLRLPLKKSLETKRAALTAAIKALEAADTYAVAEVSTAAAYEMAELYRRLGSDLIHSERPKALAGEELEQYGLLLEEQAYPFEEKAIELHAANAARAASGIYDESVRASFAALATLSPGRFGKSEESEPLTIDISAGTGLTPEISVMVRFQEAVAQAAAKATEAQREFAALRESQPSLAGPAYNLGVLLVASGHAAQAIGPLEAARALSPQDPAVADQLGVAYRQAGRFNDAAAAYRAAIAIDAALSRPHRNLCVLLDLYLGKTTDAIGEAELARANGGDEKLLTGWITEMKQRTSSSHQEAVKTP